MKKLLLPIIALFLFATNAVAASKLQVSDSGNFSSTTDNFSGGQTVYAKVETDNPGNDSRVLNVRDNGYNLLTSYNLNKSGNSYTASFSAPTSEGYYSLEAVIKSSGQNTTSVKTIKVGSNGNSSVKVNVSTSTNGSTTKTESTNNSESRQEQSSDNSSEQPNTNPTSSPEVKVEVSEGKVSVFVKVSRVVVKVVSWLWPF